MLPNEVINHMDVDELRSYVCHVQNLEDAHGNLMFAQSEIIELLQRLYDEQRYQYKQRIKYDAMLGRVRQFKRDMEQKYEQYMPRPVRDKAVDGE